MDFEKLNHDLYYKSSHYPFSKNQNDFDKVLSLKPSDYREGLLKALDDVD